MSPERPEPGSPEDWLRFARSDVAIAAGPVARGVLLESLCFHAQQAAEKAIKCVLAHHGVAVPRVHALDVLLELLPPEIRRPDDEERVRGLTVYDVMIRYPGDTEDVTPDEHRDAVNLATSVVAWASALVASRS